LGALASIPGRSEGDRKSRGLRAAGMVVWWYGMSMVKVTFTLDEATVAALRRTAQRLGSPQSQIIREAVAEYAARTDRVSEGERLRTLGILTALRKAPPSRTAAAVDAELRTIRAARRSGGRRSSA